MSADITPIAMEYCRRNYDFPKYPERGEVPETCGELGIACPHCLRRHIAKIESALLASVEALRALRTSAQDHSGEGAK